MREIVVKDANGKRITVIKRIPESILPNSFYVQIKDQGNKPYLEEDELESISKAIKIMKDNS